MSPLDLLPGWARLVIAAALAAVVVAGWSWLTGYYEARGDRAGAARVQAQWDADVIERERLHREAVDEARRKEQRMAAAAAQGERDARKEAERRAAAARADADRATAAGRRMSDDIAALNERAAAIGIPDAAACPGEFVRQRAEAVRARDVLGACAEAHRELARDADDGFAALELRHDTALGWIRSVAPGAAAGP